MGWMTEAGHNSVDHPRDDLDRFLDEELQNPEFRAAYEDAAARSGLLRTLVTCRGEGRVTQGLVAARMGTTQSAVSDLERGATDPRLSTLQRYARAIGCRLHILLQADRPRGRAWQRVRGAFTDEIAFAVAVPESTERLRNLTREGSTRDAQLIAHLTTRVAPVELRAEPDEFARAAIR